MLTNQQNEATAMREQLRRFLWTGSEAGVYQATADLTFDPHNFGSVRRALEVLGGDSIDLLLNTPQARHEAAFFALALAASPRFAAKEVNTRALAALPLVARKAQHITGFAGAAAKTRGWGRGLRTAVSGWYGAQPAKALVSQILRRPTRHLKAHRDLLRLAHPKAVTLEQNAVYQWISDGRLGHLATPELRATSLRLANGFERARAASSAAEVVQYIEEFRLGPSHVPLRWHTTAAVWEAMFDQLSYRQILRHLPAMTAAGLLGRQSAYAALAVARIADRGRIRAAGIHPLRIAEAMKQYRANTKNLVESVFDALDEALHIAGAEASRSHSQRVLVAVDGTASMQGATVSGMPLVPAALAAAAMILGLPVTRNLPALVFHRDVAREIELGVRLPELLNAIRCKPSRSDCAAPIEYAIREKLRVDAFVILTDRAADASPVAAALDRYRESANSPDTRLALLQMASQDAPGWVPGPGSLAFAGLNSHAPACLQAFLRDNEN